MDRSYLFAPGHNAKLLGRVFTAGADAVMLDLEDAVPPQHKADGAPHGRRRAAPPSRRGLGAGQRRADRRVRGRPRRRRGARRTASASRRWSRPTTWRGSPRGPRVSRSSARSRAPAACWPPQEIAAAPGVRHLAMGGVDLQRDLNTTGGNAADPLRAQPPRGLLAGGGDRAADRQRVPAAGRRRRAAGAGGVRAVAGLLRQVGDPPAAAAGAARGVHPVASGSWRGRGRCWRRSTPRAGRRCGCPTASSSTCPWRSGRGGCCSWRRPCRGCRRGAVSERSERRVSQGLREAATEAARECGERQVAAHFGGPHTCTASCDGP